MKIIVIGSPGSGKSEFTRRINLLLKYPVMHLDRVYFTSGKQHISREELVGKVETFAHDHPHWIIDGNYISTLEMRVKLCDTVIFFDLPAEICLKNAIKRANSMKKRDDIAEDFDETLSDEFLAYIKNFQTDTKPKIQQLLTIEPNKKVILIQSYEAEEHLLENFDTIKP